jgi:Flp pilus assembly protein TadD
MEKFQIIKVALIFLLSSTAFVQAQGAGSEWEALNAEAMAFYHQGNYARAVLLTQQAIEVAQKNGSSAESVGNLGCR